MPRIATRKEWLNERLALLAREKELNRLRDELAAARRELPWVRLDKSYDFEGPDGAMSLADLFAGHAQLIVYHFMLGPDWKSPCKSCSFWAEQYDGIRSHIGARDVELAVVSRAPWPNIAGVKERMGWKFPWVSSAGSSFNFDFGVSFAPEQDGQTLYNFGTQRASAGELPGLSVFVRDDTGGIFHTYSTYSRGLDPLNATYQLLDLTPKGRDEGALRWPMEWVRLKDEYA